MALTSARKEALEVALKLYEAMPKAGQPKAIDMAKQIVEAAREIEAFIESPGA